MPSISLGVPPPASTFTDASGESSGVLAKQISTRGLCVPGPAVSVSRATLTVTAVDDPWYPLDDDGPRGAEIARAACSGCPVRTQCRELARREELTFGSIHGVRGGLSAGERRATYLAQRLQDGGDR